MELVQGPSLAAHLAALADRGRAMAEEDIWQVGGAQMAPTHMAPTHMALTHMALTHTALTHMALTWHLEAAGWPQAAFAICHLPLAKACS